MSDEPRNAPLPAALFTGRTQRGNRSPQLREHGFVNVLGADPAKVGLRDERGYCTLVPRDRVRGVILPAEFDQIGVTVRLQPAGPARRTGLFVFNT